jgi:hypothetical protein
MNSGNKSTISCEGAHGGTIVTTVRAGVNVVQQDCLLTVQLAAHSSGMPLQLRTTRATLAAFYGEKPAALARYFGAIQQLVASRVSAFEPYALAQIHATLVGLEGHLVLRRDVVLNANYLAARGRMRIVRARRLLDPIRAMSWQLQLGGYEPAQGYPFTSRGLHPYARAFSIQAGKVVLIGWPSATGAVARLRRQLEPAGVLHKYHAALDAPDDDDLYFVLGNVSMTQPDALQQLTAAGRALVASQRLEVELRASDLKLITYSDTTLPLATSVAHPLEALDAIYRR